MKHAATALAIYRADPERVARVRQWQAGFDAAAAKFPGFTEARVTEPAPDRDYWAVAVTFKNERRLRAWLDSDERRDLLAQDVEGAVPESIAAIVLVQGEAPPPGTAVFTHRVVPGHEAAFQAAAHDMNVAGRTFVGYLGSTLLAPAESDGLWLSVVRFDTDEHLATWLTSTQRASLIVQLRSHLLEDFGQYTRSTPFGSIVRVDTHGTQVTPLWKTAMVVLLVLYPVVMLLSRFMGPLLADLGANPGLAMWISQVASVALLTYVCMPYATKALRWWLDPIDGADPRTSLLGVVVIAALYVVTIAVFQLIPDLQFWDY